MPEFDREFVLRWLENNPPPNPLNGEDVPPNRRFIRFHQPQIAMMAADNNNDNFTRQLRRENWWRFCLCQGCRYLCSQELAFLSSEDVEEAMERFRAWTKKCTPLSM